MVQYSIFVAALIAWMYLNKIRNITSNAWPAWQTDYAGIFGEQDQKGNQKDRT